MSADELFREEWLERHRTSGRPGEVVHHSRWVGRATAALLALVVVSVIAASRLTVARSLTVPGEVRGRVTVSGSTAVSAASAPVGAAVVFHPDGGGPPVSGRVRSVTDATIRAVLGARAAGQTGRLVVSLPRRPLLELLVPSLGFGGRGR
jgi:hypothetical protein